MKLKNKYILSLLLSFMMILSLVLINEKKMHIYNAHPPEIKRLIDLHPDKWYPVKSEVSSPAWIGSAQSEYDMVEARTYRNLDGQEVTIVMTWGRNGIQKAGHVQQLCYSAQGFSVTNQNNIEVPIRSQKLVVTNFFASQLDGDVENVFYWRISDGKLLNNIQKTGLDDQRLSHRILRMKEVVRYLFTDIPDNVMVRVSSRKYNHESDSAAPLRYIKEYLENLSSKDIKVLTGL
jgi:EpsI family protein